MQIFFFPIKKKFKKDWPYFICPNLTVFKFHSWKQITVMYLVSPISAINFIKFQSFKHIWTDFTVQDVKESKPTSLCCFSGKLQNHFKTRNNNTRPLYYIVILSF